MLRRRAKPFSAQGLVAVSEWVAGERQRLAISQPTFARQHQIPMRQVATYEALARWPAEAKAMVKEHTDKLNVSDLTRLFANRSWSSAAALTSALRRHLAGQRPRRRKRGSRGGDKSPDVLALEDNLRELLQTRVDLTGDGIRGELTISYHSCDQLEQVLRLLGAL